MGWWPFNIGAVIAIGLLIAAVFRRPTWVFVDAEYEAQFEKVTKRWLAEQKDELDDAKLTLEARDEELIDANRAVSDLEAKIDRQAESIVELRKHHEAEIIGLNGQLQESREFVKKYKFWTTRMLNEIDEAVQSHREYCGEKVVEPTSVGVCMGEQESSKAERDRATFGAGLVGAGNIATVK
jgi:RNA processing factor Prp31